MLNLALFFKSGNWYWIYIQIRVSQNLIDLFLVPSPVILKKFLNIHPQLFNWNSLWFYVIVRILILLLRLWYICFITLLQPITGMFALCCLINVRCVGYVNFSQTVSCDRQTDRQTDRCWVLQYLSNFVGRGNNVCRLYLQTVTIVRTWMKQFRAVIPVGKTPGQVNLSNAGACPTAWPDDWCRRSERSVTTLCTYQYCSTHIRRMTSHAPADLLSKYSSLTFAFILLIRAHLQGPFANCDNFLIDTRVFYAYVI